MVLFSWGKTGLNGGSEDGRWGFGWKRNLIRRCVSMNNDYSKAGHLLSASKEKDGGIGFIMVDRIINKWGFTYFGN